MMSSNERGRPPRRPLISNALNRWLNCQTVSNHRASIKPLQELATCRAMILALGAALRRKFKLEAPEASSALRTRYVTLFHTPPVELGEGPLARDGTELRLYGGLFGWAAHRLNPNQDTAVRCGQYRSRQREQIENNRQRSHAVRPRPQKAVA